MKLKSYFSGTVEAAMELARRELGEDALLVNARPSTPETRYLGAYEVVFGIPPRAAKEVPSTRTPDDLNQSRLTQEVAGLKREIERMMQSFLDARAGGHPAQISPFEAPFSQAPSAAPLAADVGETTFEVDATLGRPGATRGIVALVGPPGAGKTTTLIKLAAAYGLSSRRPAQILSADVHRIGAADQLRSLASILGIGCDVVETPGALAQMLEEHRSRGLIFIDTPGLTRCEMEDAADLADLLSSHPEIDAHLVLPAFMRATDMARILEQFAGFRPRKLLFTHIDETGGCADLLRDKALHSLPISFLGTGQKIPDDLEPADANTIAEWLWGAPGKKDSPAVPIRSRGAAA